MVISFSSGAGKTRAGRLARADVSRAAVPARVVVELQPRDDVTGYVGQPLVAFISVSQEPGERLADADAELDGEPDGQHVGRRARGVAPTTMRASNSTERAEALRTERMRVMVA